MECENLEEMYWEIIHDSRDDSKKGGTVSSSGVRKCLLCPAGSLTEEIGRDVYSQKLVLQKKT